MSNQALFETFAAEIEEVQSTLLAATADLTNPLGDLVRAQIRRSQPPICGATVLVVSMPATRYAGVAPGMTTEDGELRHKRILLAAALEMLHIALNIHRLLVKAAINQQKSGSDDSLDRAFIGSTILAGDYCFSRAAQLAAQTDHPRVVATFSLALQTVSEELLREQFNPESGSYDETRQLLESGAHAAALLVGLSTAEQQDAIQRSQELATRWTHDGDNTPGAELITAGHIQALPANWQTLYSWLIQRRGNGEYPANTPHYS